MLNRFIQKVSDGESLTQSEAAQAMEIMLSAGASDVQLAALLIALRTRGETSTELAGFLSMMREKMTRVNCEDESAVDLCGTGGDGSNSFNLSTAAALVAAAGGVTVAKHGNRAVSSRSGSADFLEALGIGIAATPRESETSLREQRFAFLFAPNYHAAAKAVAPVRRALGIRTIFNLLGPLANPAGVKQQQVGVFHERWLEPVARTLAQTGSRHVLIVHGEGGMDEISACGDTIICEYREGRIEKQVVTPEGIGIARSDRQSASGDTPQGNAERFRRLAAGAEPGLREWVVANAAPAFYLSGRASDLKEGAALARDVIASGELQRFMSKLVNGAACA